MKRQGKTIISTKIEANKDKIYRTQDINDLAFLIFPNKNAKDLRAAFILIFLAIKYSPEIKLTTSELEAIRLKKEIDFSQKTLWKARAVMSRLGIIERKYGVYWKLSSRFGKSLKNLANKIDQMMLPTSDRIHETKEWFLIQFT